MSAPTVATTRGAVGFHTHRTPHGLPVSLSVLATVPLVQAHLMVRFPLRDATELAVFDVLSAAWTDGPACDRFERAGGTVAVGRNQQWLLLSLTGPSSELPLLVETLATMPGATYPPERVRTAASRSAQQASLIGAAPAAVAGRRLWERFYGHVPPFTDPAPDPELVRAVAPADVAAAHARYVDPLFSQLVLVGDVDPDRAFALLDAALEPWHATRTPDGSRDVPRPPRTDDRGTVTVPCPAARQAHLRLAAPSEAGGGVHGFAVAQTASLVLGGSFSSRMTSVLREEHGLAYRTTCVVADHLDHATAVLEADVDPARAGEAVTRLDELLERFAADGPTGAEIDAAIGHITGRYALGLGSQSGRAACMVSHLAAGLPLSAAVDVPRHFADATPDELRRAAAGYRPDRTTGVVAGPVPGRG